MNQKPTYIIGGIAHSTIAPTRLPSRSPSSDTTALRPQSTGHHFGSLIGHKTVSRAGATGHHGPREVDGTEAGEGVRGQDGGVLFLLW